MIFRQTHAHQQKHLAVLKQYVIQTLAAKTYTKEFKKKERHKGGLKNFSEKLLPEKPHTISNGPQEKHTPQMNNNKKTTYMAVGQNPGTTVNIPKAFKIDYLGRVIIPKKVPKVLTHCHIGSPLPSRK